MRCSCGRGVAHYSVRLEREVCWNCYHESFTAEEIAEAERIEAEVEADRARLRKRRSNRTAVVEIHGPTPAASDLPVRRGDVLETISPVDYWEALRGEALADGRGRCPMPGHPDEHPSVVVYPDPGRGWWCPVCNAGGSAIDLASALTGIEPRGRDYWRLREWIAERLLSTNATEERKAA